MKTLINDKFLQAGLGLLAALPALAIEPPQDDAPPPPSVKARTSTPAEADQQATEPSVRPQPRVVPPAASSAYIGLITAEVPDLLAAHIGVKPGEGVLIRDLAPGGPAEKAGIAKFDVVTRIGGKSVGSPEEFSRLIAANKPGDEVSIDLIHEGKASAKTVKLENRPGRADRNMPEQLRRLDLGNLPEDQAERIRDLVEDRLRGIRDQQRQMEKELNFSEPRGGGGFKGFQFKSDATFRLMDENGSIEMKSSDGSKEITVRDRGNNVTWSGPWDTEQDKAAAPKEIRERIEKFKLDDSFRGNGFRFRMGPGGGFDE